MECDDVRLLQQWVLNCSGPGISFEIVPVVVGQRNPRGGRAVPGFGPAAGRERLRLMPIPRTSGRRGL
jgi:hypothetical protein